MSNKSQTPSTQRPTPQAPPKPTRQRINDALIKGARATTLEHRADWQAQHDPLGARFLRADAAKMREESKDGLEYWNYGTCAPQFGNGGELRPMAEHDDTTARMAKVDAVTERQVVLEHQASSDRMDLALKANVLTVALDLANSIAAKNHVERMLAHQMAAVHAAGMKFIARANDENARADMAVAYNNRDMRVTAGMEAQRAMNAAARAFTTFQDAALTLQKLRSRGVQKVKVIHQHVQVNEGGQAMVAGSIKTRGSQRGGKKPK